MFPDIFLLLGRIILKMYSAKFKGYQSVQF